MRERLLPQHERRVRDLFTSLGWLSAPNASPSASAGMGWGRLGLDGNGCSTFAARPPEMGGPGEALGLRQTCALRAASEGELVE